MIGEQTGDDRANFQSPSEAIKDSAEEAVPHFGASSVVERKAGKLRTEKNDGRAGGQFV